MKSLTPICLAAALIGCAKSDAHTPPAAEQPTSGAAMWGEGYFPNIPLTTQLGEKVKFFDLIKGKVVAINFIYTKCSDSCPMETARMVEVQKLIGDRLGKDIFFFSISIDPDHDTPEVLKAYAETWHAGPGWTFLTGSDADVTTLRKKLGVYEADKTKKDHGLSLLIGNQKTGRWMKRSPYENPYVLANQLGSWLHNWKQASTEDRPYANAPQVRNISSGEEFFRARCATCHTVGGGDRGNVAERKVGPDLFNITKQRDRKWLAQWMMHPDQMIADHDPIAVALLAQYQNIIMPNFRLTPSDVDNVLAYVDEESKFVERRLAKPEPAAEPIKHVTVNAEATPRVRDALGQYDQLRRRLAADDLAGAQAAATKLAAVRGVELGAGVAAISGAQDLAAARAGFGAASRQLVALLVDNPPLREGWLLFRCQMTTGYQKWVQRDEKHENPYFGTRMLECGSRLTEWEP
jgi:protein SCO1